MSTPRNALGRGIGALIPTARPSPRAEVAAVAPATPHSGELPIASIDPNPDQPRRVFSEAELESLAGSIRIHGVLQPVVVRRAGERYELIVGERRWRAAQRAGLDAIPAVVAEVDADDRLEVALVENVQRSDLNPVELAIAFRALADTGATQEEIGRRVGLDRSSIANHLRLLDLSKEIQGDLEEGRLSMGHAKALLQVTSPERRRLLRERILKDALSVRAAEQLAAPHERSEAATRRPRVTQAPELQQLADSMRRRFQTRVRIAGGAERGRFEIEYFGAEDLERISGLLLGDA
ncbi:MAG TPA: ParB/RepB/Spo0J family partition protein [Myxococcota bacterium]|nr:ParB/RepB/Spo0J family partition protein [Myxococcota bacterium]